MEQLNFSRWGVEAFILFDDEGMPLLSQGTQDEYGDIYHLSHTVLSEDEDYSVFRFSGKKLLLAKQGSRLIACTIAAHEPTAKTIHFLPEIRKHIDKLLTSKE